MKIDQYLRKEAKKKSSEIEIDTIFENIKKNNINTPKAERKANVFSSVSTLGRKHEHIKEFTGLMFIDIDDCTDREQVKEFFTELEETYATWYSSSGRNVHALIKIPICKDVKEYKRRFHAFITLAKEFIEDFAKIDTITSNPTQLAFESYDPRIYINKDAVAFKVLMPKERRRKAIRLNINPSTAREDWVIKWIQETIPYLSSPGYTQLLSHAKTLGGHCSGGYIKRDIALQFLENAINNNQYFNSSESSGSMATYQKGAKSSFEAGLCEPINW